MATKKHMLAASTDLGDYGRITITKERSYHVFYGLQSACYRVFNESAEGCLVVSTPDDQRYLLLQPGDSADFEAKHIKVHTQAGTTSNVKCKYIRVS